MEPNADQNRRQNKEEHEPRKQMKRVQRPKKKKYQEREAKFKSNTEKKKSGIKITRNSPGKSLEHQQWTDKANGEGRDYIQVEVEQQVR